MFFKSFLNKLIWKRLHDSNKYQSLNTFMIPAVVLTVNITCLEANQYIKRLLLRYVSRAYIWKAIFTDDNSLTYTTPIPRVYFSKALATEWSPYKCYISGKGFTFAGQNVWKQIHMHQKFLLRYVSKTYILISWKQYLQIATQSDILRLFPVYISGRHWPRKRPLINVAYGKCFLSLSKSGLKTNIYLRHSMMVFLRNMIGVHRRHMSSKV